MTLAVTHPFVSAKTDGTDASVIRPSNWNAGHTMTCATNVLLGRNTAGSGVVEELATSDAVIALLASATLADLLTAMGVSPATTGDIRLTLKTTATTGWLMFDDGTIGDASSSATYANVLAVDLFTLIFDNILDANAAILTSAGAATTRVAQTNAATAWAAHCRISLPKTLGRALAGAGAGSTLTSRALGAAAGGETSTLLAANLPPQTPTGTISNGAITISGSWATGGGANNNGGGGGGAYGAFTSYAGATASQAASTFAGTAFAGQISTPVSIVQPSSFLNVMVKL